MNENIIKHITSKLNELSPIAESEYKKNKSQYGIGFCFIDGLLPVEMALEIYRCLEPSHSAWRKMDSFRESKLTSKQFDQFAPLLKEVTFAFQDRRVIDCVEKITGIANQLPDSQLYAGGLSLMLKNDFLDPHIDNSHDQEQKSYRRLNLLYYVTPEWRPEYGGNLELWDKGVKHSVTIESAFNRLVLMETHRTSWHSVSTVVAEGKYRCCVSNYYFSKESPTGETYHHVTSFMARPNQPWKRIFCKLDNRIRQTLRSIKPDGFGRKDLYVQKT